MKHEETTQIHSEDVKFIDYEYKNNQCDIKKRVKKYLDSLYDIEDFEKAAIKFNEGLEIVDGTEILAIVTGYLSYYEVKDQGGSYGDGINKIYEDLSYVKYTLSDIEVEVYDEDGDVKDCYTIRNMKG